MSLLGKKGAAGEVAETTARKAHEEGWPVLIIRFNEKLTDASLSGVAPMAINQGIAAVEATDLYRFESMTVEKDDRTLGDRMAFYATFRKVESTKKGAPWS